MIQFVSAISGLFRDLHRRRVFRVAALYIVGAWVVMQAADVLFPALGIPDAAIRALLVAAVIGFPVALVFGWLFDIGPDGIQRTRPASAADLQEPAKLRRSDYLILAALARTYSASIIDMRIAPRRKSIGRRRRKEFHRSSSMPAALHRQGFVRHRKFRVDRRSGI